MCWTDKQTCQRVAQLAEAVPAIHRRKPPAGDAKVQLIC